ncbi:hypothetical protein, partial [Clostridium tertium]|uniref:hypothetical protein n=1 Tax=Clostridium tertium TaxID=1559 RepID=UPI00241F4D35
MLHINPNSFFVVSIHLNILHLPVSPISLTFSLDTPVELHTTFISSSVDFFSAPSSLVLSSVAPVADALKIFFLASTSNPREFVQRRGR